MSICSNMYIVQYVYMQLCMQQYICIDYFECFMHFSILSLITYNAYISLITATLAEMPFHFSKFTPSCTVHTTQHCTVWAHSLKNFILDPCVMKLMSVKDPFFFTGGGEGGGVPISATPPPLLASAHFVGSPIHSVFWLVGSLVNRAAGRWQSPPPTPHTHPHTHPPHPTLLIHPPPPNCNISFKAF